MSTMTETGIKCGNCGNRHQDVENVRKCHDGETFEAPSRRDSEERAAAVSAPRQFGQPHGSGFPASPKQTAFIRDLLRRRDVSALSAGFVEGLRAKLDADTLTKGEAGPAIDRLLKCDWLPKAPRPEPGVALAGVPQELTKDGMYRDPESGEIFKVQWNRAGTKGGHGTHLYAKKLVVDVEPERDESGAIAVAAQVRFIYAPGVVRQLRPEWRMTIEEAKKFGALYGTCVRCARTLTREDSIERMLGRICANADNWD